MVLNTVISYPIPPFQNLPIEVQFYNPSRFIISGITLGVTTIVTTTVDMNYGIGQLVRLLIPESFGCYQLSGKTGYVISLPASNQVELSINSSQNVNSFISSTAKTLAQILAIGDTNNGLVSTNGRNVGSTNIPGSFINISP